MSDKKHIDRIFQEKFKDFDAEPDDALWNSISKQLHPKKKKRRVVPIWWFTGGVAAALLLFFAIKGVNDFNPNPENISPIVDTQIPNNTNQSDQNKTEKENQQNLRLSENDKATGNPKNKSGNDVEEHKSKTIIMGNATNGIASQDSESNKLKERTALANNVASPKSKVALKSLLTDENSAIDERVVSNSKVNAIIEASRTDATTIIAEKEIDTSRVYEGSLNSEALKGSGSIEEAIAKANYINEEEKESINRWSIAPNVAPVYFNSLSGGSSIDAQFNNNSTQSDITMSYGIAGSYSLNKRLKIKAGINRVDFNNTTRDVLSVSGPDIIAVSSVANIENISLVPSGEDVALLSSSNFLRSSVPEAVNTMATGNLEQRFGFIEIPLAIEYRILDTNLGVNVSGGFSTFFLNSNELFADVNGQSTLIGSANNLNKTSYSANLGISLDYGLSKSLMINLEPTFKYQINTFNNTSGNFRPYFIGLYTGLSFKF